MSCILTVRLRSCDCCHAVSCRFVFLSIFSVWSWFAFRVDSNGAWGYELRYPFDSFVVLKGMDVHLNFILTVCYLDKSVSALG